jgi:hypothetical protein
MARYRMGDGTVVDTDKASDFWEEGSRWNGSNHISMATGSQWHHQRLHKSRKGRYYVEHSSNYQGTTPHVEWVSPQEACRWLLANEHDPESDGFPGDLKSLVEEASE